MERKQIRAISRVDSIRSILRVIDAPGEKDIRTQDAHYNARYSILLAIRALGIEAECFEDINNAVASLHKEVNSAKPDLTRPAFQPLERDWIAKAFVQLNG